MKMPVPIGKPQPWVLYVTVVCFAFGAFIASKVRTTPEDASAPPTRLDQLFIYYARVQDENTKLRSEIDTLRKQLDDNAEVAVNKEIQFLRALVGQTALEGPGIVITIDDKDVPLTTTANIDASALLAHDIDLLMLINELRVAEAEGLAINEQRVTANSAIRCVGPVIQVNGRPIASPFIIKAIGKVDTLYGAATIPGGVLDNLKSLGIAVEVAKREKLRVPSVPVGPKLEVGVTVNPDSGAPAR